MAGKKSIFLLSFILILAACAEPVASFDEESPGTSVSIANTTLPNPEVDTSLTDSGTLIASATARDNTPVCLEPTHPGTAIEGNDIATVDYSNASEGYIMVDYFGASNKVKLQLTGPNQVTYTYDLKSGWAAFPLVAGDGSYQISVCENIEGTKYALSFKTTLSFAGIAEFKPYLYPNQYVYFNKDNKVITKAANLAAYCENDLDVVTSVYNFMIKNITYDYEKADTVQSGYISNVDEILELGTGICLDYAAVMTSMLRSQSIPTRLEVGYVGKDMLYHAWISVYIKDVGWVNGVIQFDGKNWSLMDPTFGASTNERSLKEYIGDGTNYSVKYVY